LNNGGSAENSMPNGASNGTSGGSNGTTNGANDQTAGDDWEAYGTEGPADRTPKSPGGFALCTRDDVRTDDFLQTNVSVVPDDGWDAVAPGDAGRCGDDFETLAWRLMNCERIAQDMPPLECDLRMVWLGREHTLDMLTRDFFAHDNPDGESPYDRMERHGVSFRRAAENLADAADVLESHYSLMDSTQHRENILDDYTHVGVGSEPDGSRLLSTTIFVTPP
jgi:uncharacterized protein YkwD